MVDYNTIDNKIKEFFDQERVTPFQYGVDDCSRFAAKWVEKISGRTVIENWPVYFDETSAITALATLNYNTQEEALDDFFERIDKRQMKRGSLVGHYFPGFELMAVGVFVGDVALFKAPDGVFRLLYKKIDKNLCWSIE